MIGEKELLFENEDVINEEISLNFDKWKILLVDDEPEIHAITTLSLVDFNFENKGVEFFHAYNADEAYKILKSNNDIAIAFVDVVMETNDAGLILVKMIRNELKNHSIRIILRTGQPGEAPEREVITNYDINDYKEKTELTATRLFTIVVSSLRAYGDIIRLEKSKKKLLLTNHYLMRERERVQVTLDSIGDAVIITGSLGEITHLNPVAEKLTGWSVIEAVGRSITEVFTIENTVTRAPVHCPVKEVLYSGRIVSLETGTTLISRDGCEYQISNSASPIIEKDNSIIGVVLVFRDVTQFNKIEDNLSQSKKMDAIRCLTRGIVYDFNNYLGSVISNLELFKLNYNNDKADDKLIEQAISSTFQCIILTRQLLEFSKRERNIDKCININSLLLEMELYTRRLFSYKVNIYYNLNEELWLTKLDSSEFKNTFNIIIANISNVLSEGGEVSILTNNISIKNDSLTLNPDLEVGDFVRLMMVLSSNKLNNSINGNIFFEPFISTNLGSENGGLDMALVYGFVKRYEGFVKFNFESEDKVTIQLFLPRSNIM